MIIGFAIARPAAIARALLIVGQERKVRALTQQLKQIATPRPSGLPSYHRNMADAERQSLKHHRILR